MTEYMFIDQPKDRSFNINDRDGIYMSITFELDQSISVRWWIEGKTFGYINSNQLTIRKF